MTTKRTFAGVSALIPVRSVGERINVRVSDGGCHHR
jgi:hypothetical protein